MINNLAQRQVFASTVVEKEQRLSRSILWQLQSAFYRQSGITAWNHTFVPHYITNNPYMAAAYARVVQSYLQSCTTLDPAQPVYILELGAGSGRLAYHILQRLHAVTENCCPQDRRIVYLLTDLAESNVNFWRQHPRLQPYLESGQLDLACFDPLHDDEIHLNISGETIRAGNLANPLIVLANYFMDSLPNDLFSIHNGLLCEERITLSSPAPVCAPLDPAIMPALEISFHPHFTSPDYYFDPEFDRLLQSYLPHLDGCSFQFPTGALESLRRLIYLSGGQMLFLTADKGMYRLEDLRSKSEPEISIHGNAISMMVNLHALAGFIQQQGGQAFQTKHREEGLVISAFLMGASPAKVQAVHRAFEESIEESSPDDFFMVKKAFEQHYASASFEQLLAFLHLSGDDPQIFSGMYPYLIMQIDSADLWQQERLYETIRRVWKQFYPIGEPFDVQLALAKVFIALSHYSEALECLRSSQYFYKANAETDRLIALCLEQGWVEATEAA